MPRRDGMTSLPAAFPRRARGLPVWPLPAQEPSGQRPGQCVMNLATRLDYPLATAALQVSDDSVQVVECFEVDVIDRYAEMVIIPGEANELIPDWISCGIGWEPVTGGEYESRILHHEPRCSRAGTRRADCSL